MVKKNVKYGEIKNVTVIELGYGDVKVSDTLHKDNTVGVMFYNDTPRPIGEIADTYGKTSNETGIDAIIHFRNIESIEVVEKAISRAKSELKRILKMHEGKS